MLSTFTGYEKQDPDIPPCLVGACWRGLFREWEQKRNDPGLF